jgi:hypothetical protein
MANSETQFYMTDSYTPFQGEKTVPCHTIDNSEIWEQIRLCGLLKVTQSVVEPSVST